MAALTTAISAPFSDTTKEALFIVICGIVCVSVIGVLSDMATRHHSGGSNHDPFESIERSAVPTSRKSKHHEVVQKILREAESLRTKKALKIPRSALGSAKIENIRAALSRASTKTKLELNTSVDDHYFYVWRAD
ncbi:MAG TPA: hypothetical protein VKB58_10485 [Terriglobales bacterium]|nr:hypothetical protein [Terriglobales bacterium]